MLSRQLIRSGRIITPRLSNSILKIRSRRDSLLRSLSTVNRSVDTIPSASRVVPRKRRMSNTGSSSSSVDYGHFELLQSFDVKHAPLKIQKFRSRKTGLTVLLGSHASPLTHGYFVVASEIFDDTGRPHTLEHLVFLGSKDYPYKGVLDQLANRAGADGTNAWTDTDHTAYTIATAGSSGFLRMLPVYIDHILHPTLSDAGYVTEVHHINGEGEDAGVVYSEMQARENQSYDVLALAIQRALYPKHSAYRSETGGLMANLRTLNNQMIREYHSTYYVPHNLCLVIDGNVPIDRLFEVLHDEVEPKIMAHQKSASTGEKPYIPPKGWKRPFVETSTAQPLTIERSVEKTILFMEHDETIGEVTITGLGPDPNDFVAGVALHVLGKYLTHSSASPLQKEFVEIPAPYATAISFYDSDRVHKKELSLSISDVPTKHLDSIGKMVMEKLRRIVESEGIDMKRMELVLRQQRRKLLSSIESNVTNAVSGAGIPDFLYGDCDGKDLPAAFDDLSDYTALERWTENDWKKLLEQYWVDNNVITYIAKPSAKEADRIEQEEAERLEQRKQELGADRLKELGRQVQAAKDECNRPVPETYIKSFPMTAPADLTWIPVETAVNNIPGQSTPADQGALQEHIDDEETPMHFQTHFVNIPSNFVDIHVLHDTIDLPSTLRPFMSVMQAALFNVAVQQRDGTELTHEEVVNQLNDFTVSHGVTYQFRGAFEEVFKLSIKAEKADYGRAIGWLRDVLQGSQFTVERLKVIVAKMLQELPTEKRDGQRVARAVVNNMAFDAEKSTSESCSLLGQLDFLPEAARQLEEDPEKFIAQMEEARQHLLDPSYMRIVVSGDVLGIPSPRGIVAKSFLPLQQPEILKPLSISAQTLSPLGQNPGARMTVVPLASIEGSFANHYAKGPQGWDHPDLPALILAESTLNGLESYLWKSIRGSGLAYGSGVEIDQESGLVGFYVYRSPNAMLAYEAAGKVLRGLVDGSTELSQDIVDGARTSLLYSYASSSASPMAAATSAYLHEALKGVGKDYQQRMLAELPRITLEVIRRVIEQYFLPIFVPGTSFGAVAVSAGKPDELEAAYKNYGFDVQKKDLPSVGGDEDSDEEMDEDNGSESDGSRA